MPTMTLRARETCLPDAPTGCASCPMARRCRALDALTRSLEQRALITMSDELEERTKAVREVLDTYGFRYPDGEVRCGFREESGLLDALLDEAVSLEAEVTTAIKTVRVN